MKNLKKIALAADLTEMDEKLLHFIKGYDSLFDFEELHIIHQIEIEDLSEDLENLLKKKSKTLEELIRDEIESTVIEVFGSLKPSIHIYIQPKPDFSELVNWINNSQFDLFFLGKKKSLDGTGIFSSKMVRLLSCNLILVPETAKPVISKILTPIDFSSYTQRVLEVSELIAKNTKSEFIPLHVLKIGIHYFPFFGNEKKIQKSLQKEADSKFEKLKKKLNIDGNLLSIIAEDDPIGVAIFKKAKELKVDLIIISKKGKSDDSDLLIGSVAENLIANDKNISVAIIK
ncbi:universal stress protein [Algoriphagus zhangzhouensis]|uniref:Nucleotide-binding universal stress protein, UspA family n=1 Tax=Algoriphagus zhangzhouensis TaxID=1073327 RepID=A0A1M7ZB26_9BACT|nr:universal stress protein [Algoriphagus zhangzhouensis]TDY46933.1 nucleotide-binding universal stress UspA family protein [Algoriphagus zhangzhouensis]SHO62108.1 Nucleotide-binding universal stress protein, UspA family [Algoriphagus zhangzhouensis]